MFNLFKKAKPKLYDSELGQLEYFKDKIDEYWVIMELWSSERDNAFFEFMAIPGNENGPYKYGLEFFLSKQRELQSLWELANSELQEVIETDFSNEEKTNPKEIFTLNSLTMDNESKWDVGFLCNPKLGWLFVEFHVINGKVESIDVDRANA